MCKSGITDGEEYLKEASPSISGVSVKLIKNIPMQTDLGGGSTNCASFIHGTNLLFNLNMAKKEMFDLGKTLSADVVPCMFNPVKSEGIEELVTPFNSNLKYYILIAKPDFNCNTKIMYEKLDNEKNLKQEYYTNEVINILKTGETKELRNKLYNVFEYALQEGALLDNIKNDFINSGSISTLLFGSDSSIYGIYSNKEDLKQAYKFMKNKYNYNFYKCISYNNFKGDLK